MSDWYSIEVLDGLRVSARGWAEAYHDDLIRTAIQEGATDWSWLRRVWGVVLELEFEDEAVWERFRAMPVVQAALDAVPDHDGVFVYRGRGGSSGARDPRRPAPRRGAGVAALPIPESSDPTTPRRPGAVLQLG